MLSRIQAAAVLGIDAYLVDVEVDITNGLPSFSTVGLPHGAVREGRERIFPALANGGFKVPLKKITVNLAPADVRKDGSAFDLPIAIGLLTAGSRSLTSGLRVRCWWANSGSREISGRSAGCSRWQWPRARQAPRRSSFRSPM